MFPVRKIFPSGMNFIKMLCSIDSEVHKDAIWITKLESSIIGWLILLFFDILSWILLWLTLFFLLALPWQLQKAFRVKSSLWPSFSSRARLSELVPRLPSLQSSPHVHKAQWHSWQTNCIPSCQRGEEHEACVSHCCTFLLMDSSSASV